MNLNKYEKGAFGEMLRRYVCFHNGENMEDIKLWSLMRVNNNTQNMIKRGLILSYGTYTEENVTGWYYPTKQAIQEILIPAYNNYLSDTGRHKDEMYDFDSYNGYVYKLERQ